MAKQKSKYTDILIRKGVISPDQLLGGRSNGAGSPAPSSTMPSFSWLRHAAKK